MSKVSSKNLAEAVYKATEGKSGAELKEALRRSVKMIDSKRMIDKSQEILKALQSISDTKTSTIRMKVTTSKKIGSEEKKRIEYEVKEKYKAKSVVSEFFEKEELLGGVRIEVEDEVTDSSYRSKLQKLENFLKQEK
jgi:F0F1-type ATP synthase delta subunit